MKYFKYIFLIFILDINGVKKEIQEVKIEDNHKENNEIEILENNKEKEIKKKVNDLLNEYIEKKNITIKNFQELLNIHVRKKVLSDMYHEFNKDKSLINKYSNNFYLIKYNKKKYTERIEKGYTNLKKIKDKAEYSILKFMQEFSNKIDNNIYDFFQTNFNDEEMKYDIYNWLLVGARRNILCKISYYKKHKLNKNSTEEKILVESLQEKLKINKYNIKDFENDLEKKEDIYLKQKFEKYYWHKNNKVKIEEQKDLYTDEKLERLNNLHIEKNISSIYDNNIQVKIEESESY